MSTPVVVVPAGGIAVTEVPNGMPVTSVSAYGFAVTVVAEGGLPVTGVDAGSSVGPDYRMVARPGRYVLSGESMEIVSGYQMQAGAGEFALSFKDATLTPPVASYTGPGDIQSGAVAWYGLRAYNAAYATALGNCIDIVDQAGAHPLTVKVKADGSLDVAAISAWVTANTVTTIKVAQIYDQVGTQHLISPGSALANMVPLVLSGFGTKPVLRYNSSAYQTQAATVYTLAQVFSMSTVAKRTAGTGINIIFGSVAASPSLLLNGAGAVGLFAGSGVVDFTSAAAENVFHTIQGVFDGAASIGQWDTTVVNPIAGNPGTGGFSSQINVNNPSYNTTMDWVEGGIWTGNKVSTFAAVHTNAKTYWGY